MQRIITNYENRVGVQDKDNGVWIGYSNIVTLYDKYGAMIF